MKFPKFVFLTLLVIFYFSNCARAQNCFHPSASIIPVSFYQQNNEAAYIYFSGDSTFLRGPYSEQLNFLSVSNNYKVDISFSVSMSGTGTIMGQNFNDYGWYIAFDQNDSNKLKFFMSMGPYNVQKFEIPASSPPYDTNWVTFRIVYNKATAVLTTYRNGIFAHQYNNISWQYQTDPGASFALGARNVTIHYGYADYSAKDFFRGSINDLLIKINDTNYINVNFNWGGGQFALDSASFFQFDRVWSDIPNNIMRGFSFGNSIGADRYDPVWVKPALTDTNFSTLGSGFYRWSESAPIQSMEAWQANSVLFAGSLYVTGNHNRVNGTPLIQGDTSWGISRWDESSGKWRSVSGGLNGYGLHVNTWYNHINNEYLVVTGVFDKLRGTGTTVNNIALWNGTNWSALQQPVTNAAGITNTSYTGTGFVTASYQGDLVIGGTFNAAGGISAANIARWRYNSQSGTYSWDKFGSGLGNPLMEGVFALAVFNNELYAGGNFNLVSGAGYAAGLAKWDNANNRWVLADIPELNSPRTIQVLYVFDNKLWAGGSFRKIGGVLCNGLGYFDGNVWHDIGTGGNETGLSGCSQMIYGGEATDMVSDGYNLYVCGSFEKINGQLCNKIAVYDRKNWCSIGYGVDLRPEGLSIYNEKLVITGDLYSAEGINMNNIALYDIRSFTLNGINNNNSSTANTFSLSQNYPNPFNPSTKIKFYIPNAGTVPRTVRLIIYDILGREVSILINGKLEAGAHEVSWNASSYPSGVYFYKLVVGDNTNNLDFSGTKKMVLVK